jgi:hypothetical protein
VRFSLKSYNFDRINKTAHFCFENSGIEFTETVEFNNVIEDYNRDALDKALFLAFVLIGTSYYKAFPHHDVDVKTFDIDEVQASFFDSVYQEGLSQYAYENKINREDLGHFKANIGSNSEPVNYQANDDNPLVLQSGGKDSLLLAQLLKNKGQNFSPWHMANSSAYPKVLDTFGQPVIKSNRQIDMNNLRLASGKGALDGHVPITYIVLSLALIQAILLGKKTVLTAIGHEGEEPYSFIGDLPVAHQWSKTWQAEVAFSDYVHNYISKDIQIGSPLRRYSELKIAEMFVKHAWEDYSREFSSCNVINYKLGNDNSKLGWCGICPKCANSFLLFAPFVDPSELKTVFNGDNLFNKDSLTQTFKALMGIGDLEKPFECVGEEAELRRAYHMAHDNSDEYTLPFEVPDSDYDYNAEFSYQAWTTDFI